MLIESIPVEQSISMLGLSARAYNCLMRTGIATISQLLAVYPLGYTAIGNAGPTTWEDIDTCLRKWLQRHGLSFSEMDSLSSLATQFPLNSLSESDLQNRIPESRINLVAPYAPTANQADPADNGDESQELGNVSTDRLSLDEVVRAIEDDDMETLALTIGPVPLREILSCELLSRLNMSDLAEALRIFKGCQLTITQFEPSPMAGVPIAELSLPPRAHNCLYRNGIRDITMLCERTPAELFAIRQFGVGSCVDVLGALFRRRVEILDYLHAQQSKEPAALNGAEPRSESLEFRDAITHTQLDELSLAVEDDDIDESATRVAPVFFQDPATERSSPCFFQPTIELLNAIDSDVKPKTFQTLLNDWLERLDSRTREIVCHRYGLGCDSETLPELAERFGITRARIHQIINNKALPRLARLRTPAGRNQLSPFANSLQEFLLHKGGLVSEQEIAMELPLVVDLGDCDPVLTARIVADTRAKMAWLRGLQLLGDASKPLQRVSDIRKRLRNLVKQSGSQISLAEALLLFCSSRYYHEACDSPGEDFILACARTDPELVISDGYLSLPTPRDTVTDKVVRALRHIGRPAHHSEIIDALNATLPSSEECPSDNYVRTNLTQNQEAFVRVGRGIYGLAEWGLPNDGCVANAVCRVLREARHPLSSDEIVERVLTTWQVAPNTVRMAISSDDRIRRLKSNLYTV